MKEAILSKGREFAVRRALKSTGMTGCVVSLWYAADGTVRAAQLVRRTPSPLIDAACLEVVMGRKVIAHDVESEGGGHAELPISWSYGPWRGAAPHLEPDPSIPAVASRSALYPFPEYPEDALRERA